MLTLLTSALLSCVRVAQMPFGKNKRLSVPRPKKKKVVRIEEEPEEEPLTEKSAAGAQEPSPPLVRLAMLVNHVEYHRTA